MIDFHCHILPGIDDGAKDFDTSLRMCRIAQMNGIEHIVATPHMTCIGDIDEFIEQRDIRLNELSEAVYDLGMELNFYPGAEVYVDDDVFFSSKLNRLTINNSRYILVEFSFGDVPIKKIIAYLDAIVEMGLVPIIAHPERYSFFQYNYDAVNMLMKNGAIFQINASSLASLDGPQEFELAYAMAYNGVASIIGTDAHSDRYRTNNLREMIEMFPPDISQLNMENMLHNSAKAVLQNKEIPVVERIEISKRGF
ncbi:MAG: hypothetical protein KBT46_04575 [Ruminococcus sp.]|nr:hypothetical protein [Candidatus Copronaster equi]